MVSQIIILITTLAISCLIGYLLSSHANLRTTMKDSIIGGALGAVLITIILLQYELVEVRNLKDKILNPNNLTKVEELLNRSSDEEDIMHGSIVKKKNKIVKELSNMLDGSFYLNDEDEVINEWKCLLKNVTTSIKAINYVTPKFWLKDSTFSTFQYSVQKDAKERGINIR